MSKTTIRIAFNRNGMTELLKSKPLLDDLEARAGRIKDALTTDGGEEYAASAWVGKDRTGGRAMAMVKTANYEARATTAEHLDLLYGLEAGRG